MKKAEKDYKAMYDEIVESEWFKTAHKNGSLELPHNTPKISEGDIKQAASDYEKIACCEKDHTWLKEYVNEDFEAGVKWTMQEINADTYKASKKIDTVYVLELVKTIRNDSELGFAVRKYVQKQTL